MSCCFFPCALYGPLASKQVRVDSTQSGKVREQQGCGTEIHCSNLHHVMRVLFDLKFGRPPGFCNSSWRSW